MTRPAAACLTLPSTLLIIAMLWRHVPKDSCPPGVSCRNPADTLLVWPRHRRQNVQRPVEVEAQAAWAGCTAALEQLQRAAMRWWRYRQQGAARR